MACADVARAKAKPAAINLVILCSYVARCDAGLGSHNERHYRPICEPSLTNREWVEIPTFSGANPQIARSPRPNGSAFSIRAPYRIQSAFAALKTEPAATLGRQPDVGTSTGPGAPLRPLAFRSDPDVAACPRVPIPTLRQAPIRTRLVGKRRA